MSIGHCNALAEACQYFGALSINRIIFDNCGIDDTEFASILEGIQKLQDFKKIIYKYNVFEGMSLHNLIPLFQRKIPNHLEELRIENCKMSQEVTLNLIESIAEKSYLKKLGLVNVNINEEAFAILTEYITESTLTELDISWGNVSYISMSYFLEVLSDNKKIQFVNLAWN